MTNDELVEAMAKALYESDDGRPDPWPFEKTAGSESAPHYRRARAALAVAAPEIRRRTLDELRKATVFTGRPCALCGGGQYIDAGGVKVHHGPPCVHAAKPEKEGENG